MSILLAQWLVGLLGLYGGLGVLFAVPFLTVGVQRIDPAATGATVGFRLVILPGVVALWPLLAFRWWQGRTVPPEERTAHRRAAVPPDVSSSL